MYFEEKISAALNSLLLHGGCFFEPRVALTEGPSGKSGPKLAEIFVR
jgi:hypothetical protein